VAVVTISNGSNSAVSISIPGAGISGLILNAGASTSVIVPSSTTPYVVNFTVVGQPQCSFTKGVTVNCCINDPVNNVTVFYSCSGTLPGIQISGAVSGITVRGPGNIIWNNGTLLPAGVYTYTIQNQNGCTKTQTLTVPTCYKCLAGVCSAAPANNNTGFSSLATCNNNCITDPDPCELKCYDIYIHNGDGGGGLIIDGIPHPTNLSTTGCINGVVFIDPQFQSKIQNALNQAGDCGVPVVGNGAMGVPYEDIDNPDECSYIPFGGPTVCHWVRVKIYNTGLNIQGTYFGTDTGCMVPAVEIPCVV
jgi:hypothetical protein